MEETKCRVCGATEPPRQEPSGFAGNWEVAVPDNLEGAVLLDNTEVWCSHECRDRDPRYKPFKNGAEMFDAYNRFGEANSIDLIGAFARSRGVSEAEAKETLERGFDKGLKALRKTGRQ